MTDPDSGTAAVQVRRGAPTPAELAALIAVLCARSTTPAPLTGYAAWRAGRLAALKAQRAR
jgi:hypothetical protein